MSAATDTAGKATAAGDSAAKNGVRNYALVTLAYWCDTLADGAIRTLVLFYFYQLGYSALQVASLFLFYEIFGIVTNFCGGYLGSRFGLKTTDALHHAWVELHELGADLRVTLGRRVLAAAPIELGLVELSR